MAESEKARPLAVTLAVGFDIAAFMNLFSIGVAPIAVHWPPNKLPDTVILPGETPPGSTQ
jgi:hypothetical protein